MTKDQLTTSTRSFFRNGGIAFGWLLHLSAIIGITLGYQEWFVSKTPFNLLFITGLLLFFFPVDSKKKWGLFLVLFTLGMTAEILGVNLGWFFGTYSYGENLGIKWWGVPVMIGVNWALLTFITGQMAKILFKNPYLIMVTGAVLMLVLDLLMEPLAPEFDFWSFGEEVPLSNFISWFVLALIMQFLFVRLQIRGDKTLSIHLYLMQGVFFLSMLLRLQYF